MLFIIRGASRALLRAARVWSSIPGPRIARIFVWGFLCARASSSHALMPFYHLYFALRSFGLDSPTQERDVVGWWDG